MSIIHARINARAAEQRRRVADLRWHRSTPALAIELAKQAAMPSLARVGLAVKYGSDAGFNPAHDGWRWIEHATKAGLRVVGSSHEICKRLGSRRVDHQGWYTYPGGDPSDTIHGVVIALSSRKGQRRYMLGYSDADNPDCYRVRNEIIELSPQEFTDDGLIQLAADADRLAEIAAEKERDYQEASDNLLRAKEAMSEAAEAVRDAVADYRRALRISASADVAKDDAKSIMVDADVELEFAREAYQSKREAAMEALDRAKQQGIGWRDV